MKPLKTTLALLLCLLLTAGTLTVCGFAAEPLADDAQLPDCLVWEVTFDKASYGLFDTVNATVTVTNVSDQTLGNLHITADAADFSPFVAFDSRSILAGGEACSFSFAWKLSQRASGLPFFARLLLALRDLLLGRVRGNAALSDPLSTASAQADFGRYGQREIRLAATYQPVSGDRSQIAQIVAQFNAAVKKGTALTGKATLTYVEGSLHTDSSTDAVLRQLEPALRTSLEKNSVTVDTLPGSGPLLPEDVLAVSVREDAETTVLELLLADQYDGFDADPVNGGAVARGCGPLASFKSSFDEIGLRVLSGEESITATYSQPVIRVTIDNATGKILAGSWHYRTSFKTGDAQFFIGGIRMPTKNFICAVDTDIVFPSPAA